MKKSNLFLVVILLAAIFFSGCTVTKEQMAPYRTGNRVEFFPHDWIFVNITDLDVVYVTMDGYTQEFYVKSLSTPYMVAQSPISQKVHVIVDILYVNGTKERFYEGDL